MDPLERRRAWGSERSGCARSGDQSKIRLVESEDWINRLFAAGFRVTTHLASVPSRFLGSIYSAITYR